jgi:hypothetical protein
MPQLAIGVGVTSTLAYLLYREALSAILIYMTSGGIGMLGTRACPDLAAKACPKQAAGMVFARLMSAYNGGGRGSEIFGGWLYDALKCTWLIVFSASCTTLGWLIVPLVVVEQIEGICRKFSFACHLGYDLPP